MPESHAEAFSRERDRCVDRLRGMTLARLPEAAALAHAAARRIVDLTPGAGGRPLPRLADHAAGDQLAVVASDFLAAAPDAAALDQGTAILTELRRSLP